jgi:hypothetical protein
MVLTKSYQPGVVWLGALTLGGSLNQFNGSWSHFKEQFWFIRWEQQRTFVYPCMYMHPRTDTVLDKEVRVGREAVPIKSKLCKEKNSIAKSLISKLHAGGAIVKKFRKICILNVSRELLSWLRRKPKWNLWAGNKGTFTHKKIKENCWF